MRSAVDGTSLRCSDMQLLKRLGRWLKRRLGKLQTWAEVAQVVESFAAVIALGGAAWWFFEQRENYPRAQLQQTVEVVPLEPGLVSVEAQIRFENIGKQRIELTAARVKLQNVSSEPYDYRLLATLTARHIGEPRGSKTLNRTNSARESCVGQY